jgi:hypothetical protein
MATIRITREQAAAALRAAANNGTVKVLWSSHSGCFTLEERAIDVLMAQLEHASLLAYQPGPFGYDLSMLLGLTVHHLDVPMPDQSPAEAFLAEYGEVIFDLLEQEDSGISSRTEDAYQALVEYMSNRDELEGS